VNIEIKDETERIKFYQLLGEIEHKLEEMISSRHYMNENAIKKYCEEILNIIDGWIIEQKESDVK
jgi:hypothetical protein